MTLHILLYVFYFFYEFCKSCTAVCYIMCLCNCPLGTNKLNGISWVRVPEAKPCEEKKLGGEFPVVKVSRCVRFPLGISGKSFNGLGSHSWAVSLLDSYICKYRSVTHNQSLPTPRVRSENTKPGVWFMFCGKGCRKEMKHAASECFSVLTTLLLYMLAN